MKAPGPATYRNVTYEHAFRCALGAESIRARTEAAGLVQVTQFGVMGR